MTPAEKLRKLFFMAHRAECEAAIAAPDVTGNYPDIRDEDSIPKTEEGNFIFNLGVSAGIKALFTEMSREGYKILGPDGKPVGDVVADLGDRFQIWMNMPDQPNLRLIKNQQERNNEPS